MTSIKRAAGIRLLGVFAHPDDEQIVAGPFARAVRQGATAHILCATRGEEGQISDPALATPETLGAVREQELREAAAIHGWEPPILLDYRDGTLPDVDPNELSAAVVKVIRELKPQVLVTFEATGIYGHLDHIAIHHAATAAFTNAADREYRPELGRAHQVKKFYYATQPRSLMQAFIRSMGDEADVGGDRRTIDLETMGVPDEEITTVVETPELFEQRRAGMLAHRTQFGPEMIARFDEVAAVAKAWLGSTALIRVYPPPAPGAELPDEDDLLAGLTG
jgi:LmbE family N-acetylglucosaminyl deacetylase